MWNAIASSMLSGLGSPCFGVTLDCAVGAEHSAELDMGKSSYHRAFLYWPNFPVISVGHLNKLSVPAIPVSRLSSAWGLLTWLSILACTKKHQDLVNMKAS